MATDDRIVQTILLKGQPDVLATQRIGAACENLPPNYSREQLSKISVNLADFALKGSLNQNSSEPNIRTAEARRHLMQLDYDLQRRRFSEIALNNITVDSVVGQDASVILIHGTPNKRLARYGIQPFMLLRNKLTGVDVPSVAELVRTPVDIPLHISHPGAQGIEPTINELDDALGLKLEKSGSLNLLSELKLKTRDIPHKTQQVSIKT